MRKLFKAAAAALSGFVLGKLIAEGVKHFGNVNVSDKDDTFSGVVEGNTLTLYAGRLGGTEYTPYHPQWMGDCHIERVAIDPSMKDIHPKILSNLFNGLENLKTIEGLDNIRTDKCEKCYCMFKRCAALEHIDLNLPNVEDLGFIFADCKSLQSAKIQIGQSANNAACMFEGCKKLTDVTLICNQCNIASIDSIFSGCESIKKIDLSAFNMRTVNSCYHAFAWCGNLKQIILGDCTNLREFHYCTHWCKSLKSVRAHNPSADFVKYLNGEGITVEEY